MGVTNNTRNFTKLEGGPKAGLKPPKWTGERIREHLTRFQWAPTGQLANRGNTDQTNLVEPERHKQGSPTNQGGGEFREQQGATRVATVSGARAQAFR